MLQQFLPPFLLGIVSFSFYILNTLFWGVLFIGAGVIKALVPIQAVKEACLKAIHQFAYGWGLFTHWHEKLTHRVEWDIEGAEKLNPNAWYLIIFNHQNWIDAVALQETLNGKVSPFKFFAKSEILWMPVLGLCVWAAEYPLMYRYSKEYLKKHPEKKGKDLVETYAACQKFRQYPVAIGNFVEGTRFTEHKHQIQNSPYKHLLKPKAGGVGLVMTVLGDKIKEILDVTFVYPDGKHNFWDFLCGRVKRVIVRVRKIPVTADLKGDYVNDSNYRSYFQTWLNERWKEKDALIESLMPCALRK